MALAAHPSLAKVSHMATPSLKEVNEAILLRSGKAQVFAKQH